MTPEEREAFVTLGLAILFLFFFSYGIALFKGDTTESWHLETGVYLGVAMLLFLYLARRFLRNPERLDRERSPDR